MKAIVGLGNPGPRYRNTRHNAGWHVLDELYRRWGGGKPVQARHAEVVKTAIAGEPVLLVKPQTFMNDSGKAVRALVEKDGLEPERILVVYDDLDLPAGRIRIRGHGSSGGHGGIKSIQQHLSSIGRLKNRAPDDQSPDHDPFAFPRLKVGLGRPPAGVDPIDFVLARFVPDELTFIRPAILRGADAAEAWVAEGTEVAANRFNGV
jgi:peptidyl-tRNA hydrolase, PTH1 family